MARQQREKWNYFHAKLSDGKLLVYVKSEQDAVNPVEVNGKMYDRFDSYKGRITGFGILEVDKLDFRILELVIQDDNVKERFCLSIPFQGYGASLNLIQRMRTIYENGGFDKEYEFSSYDFESKDEETGKTYRNRGFTFKDESGKKVESYKFTNLPEIVLLKEATKTKKALYDDSERMEFLEKEVDKIRKMVYEFREVSSKIPDVMQGDEPKDLAPDFDFPEGLKV